MISSLVCSSGNWLLRRFSVTAVIILVISDPFLASTASRRSKVAPAFNTDEILRKSIPGENWQKSIPIVLLPGGSRDGSKVAYEFLDHSSVTDGQPESQAYRINGDLSGFLGPLTKPEGNFPPIFGNLPQAEQVFNRRERRLPNGVVFGRFGYIDSDGKQKETHYVSDDWGYRMIEPGANVTIYPAAAENDGVGSGGSESASESNASYHRKKNGVVILYTSEMSNPDKKKRNNDEQVSITDQPSTSSSSSLSSGSVAADLPVYRAETEVTGAPRPFDPASTGVELFAAVTPGPNPSDALDPQQRLSFRLAGFSPDSRRRGTVTISKIVGESALSPGEALTTPAPTVPLATPVHGSGNPSSGSSSLPYVDGSPNDIWYHGNLDPSLPEKHLSLAGNRDKVDSSSSSSLLHNDDSNNKQSFGLRRPGTVIPYPLPEFKPIPKPGSLDDPHVQLMWVNRVQGTNNVNNNNKNMNNKEEATPGLGLGLGTGQGALGIQYPNQNVLGFPQYQQQQQQLFQQQIQRPSYPFVSNTGNRFQGYPFGFGTSQHGNQLGFPGTFPSSLWPFFQFPALTYPNQAFAAGSWGTDPWKSSQQWQPNHHLHHHNNNNNKVFDALQSRSKLGSVSTPYNMYDGFNGFPAPSAGSSAYAFRHDFGPVFSNYHQRNPLYWNSDPLVSFYRDSFPFFSRQYYKRMLKNPESVSENAENPADEESSAVQGTELAKFPDDQVMKAEIQQEEIRNGDHQSSGLETNASEHFESS